MTSVERVDQGAQQSAERAEEGAPAATCLRGPTRQLVRAVAVFRLRS